LPDTAWFSGDCRATEPTFSPDGKFLYFSSSKDKPGIKNYNLWRIEKTDDGWSEAVSLFDVGGDAVWEFHPSVSGDGALFFCWWDTLHQVGDIYMSQCNERGCSEPVRVDILNSDASDVDSYIGPDGSFIIFASNRPGGYGLFDHYISFKKDDGSWTTPENMGPDINSGMDDYDMDLSPDGKYIFQYLNGDIYWKEARDLTDSYMK
jgi:Tol biopolymer transport system component